MTTNVVDDELFERIVQEVIRRLLEGGTDLHVRGDKQLRLEERVVTLATLDGKLTGITSLYVRKKAVVTPAVKDELKYRGIELVMDR